MSAFLNSGRWGGFGLTSLIDALRPLLAILKAKAVLYIWLIELFGAST